MNYVPLSGVIVPLVTPFHENGEVDYENLKKVVDFVISKGVNSVMVGGTTGEGFLLNLNERKKVLETVIEHVNARVAVIAHTGCIDTRSTVELSKHAVENRADFISVIVPFFYTLNDEQIYRHFAEVAQAVPETPILLYTFPGNSKNDISPQLLELLLQTIPNIKGIKSSNDDLVRFQEYVKIGGEDFIACFGVDELMLGGLVFGSKAQISGNANSFPEPFIGLFKAFQAGDIPGARKYQEIINGIVKMHHAGATTAYFKATLKFRGINAGCVRSPMRELTSGEIEILRKEMMQMGMI